MHQNITPFLSLTEASLCAVCAEYECHLKTKELKKAKLHRYLANPDGSRDDH